MGKGRRRAIRRDRHLAKASGYIRLPRKAGIAGHGTGISLQHLPQIPMKKAPPPRAAESLGDLKVGLSDWLGAVPSDELAP